MFQPAPAFRSPFQSPYPSAVPVPIYNGGAQNQNALLYSLLPVAAYYLLADKPLPSTAVLADVITSSNNNRTAALGAFGAIALLSGIH